MSQQIKPTTTILLVCLIVLSVVSPALALEKGPVGGDKLVELDKLPYLFLGSLPMHASSCDDRGLNDDHDWFYSSNPYVVFDDKGPGCITRMWFTNRIGTEKALLFGDINIYIDGNLVLSEDLLTYYYIGSFDNYVDGGIFSGWYSNTFPYPIVGNRDDSSGGFYSYTPIQYEESCKIIITNYNPSGKKFYYNIDYTKYDTADGLQSFNATESLSAADALWTNTMAGMENYDPKQPASVTNHSGTTTIAATGSTQVANITGPGSISAIRMRLGNGAENDAYINDLVMRIEFDNRPADVRCVLGHMFAIDLEWPEYWGYNGSTWGWLPLDVKGLLFGANRSNNWLYNYFPMPFGTSAKVYIENNSGSAVTLDYSIDVADMPTAADLLAAGQVGYFSSTQQLDYLDSWISTDYTLMEYSGRGKVVGMVYSPRGFDTSQSYLEGDERIYIDGLTSPNIYGTGTEDTFNGGWYMKWGHFSLPTHGYTARIQSPKDNVSLYRLFIGDEISFNSYFRFLFEHGVTNETMGRAVKYTIFFYAAATGPQISYLDEVEVGDTTSETAHSYSATGDSYVNTSTRYNTSNIGIYLTDSGRHFSGGGSQFTVSIDPDNYGVKLRRRLNHAVADQEANISVDGQYVGIWRDAGYNTSYKTWLESDFHIPHEFTRGKSSITVSVTPTAAWTEYKYWAFSFSTANIGYPPDVPEASDTGDYTTSTSELSFTWTAPELSLWETTGYEYAIGTSPGADDVRGWTDAGTTFAKTAMGLSLVEGGTYFISVRATNEIDETGTPANTDGIQVAVSAPDVASAKKTADNTYVELSGQVVTATFTGAFYIEQADRSSGIRVESVDTVAPGDVVDVVGKSSTTASGEKCVTDASVTVTGANVVTPLGMTGGKVGGGDFEYSQVTGSGQQAMPIYKWSGTPAPVLVVENMVGMSNVGLLVTVWGSVTWVHPSGNGFYIDDGSVNDDWDGVSEPAELFVTCENGTVPPAVGQYVRVTGVVGAYTHTDGMTRRTVLVDEQADITIP